MEFKPHLKHLFSLKLPELPCTQVSFHVLITIALNYVKKKYLLCFDYSFELEISRKHGQCILLNFAQSAAIRGSCLSLFLATVSQVFTEYNYKHTLLCTGKCKHINKEVGTPLLQYVCMSVV